MRLFVALDIEDAIRQRIATFMDGVCGFAPDVRWVRSESLHLTLKVIGEFPERRMDALQQALRSVQGKATAISFRGYGFFPTAKAARVFWVGMEADANLAPLANAIDDAAARSGIAREERAFTPHLTLARAGSGRPPSTPIRAKSARIGGPGEPGDRPGSAFRVLQEKLAALPPPEFGSMTAHEFFLYESKLSPSGAQYSKLERFALVESQG